MATQIFKPEITTGKEEVGSSIYWSYTYDGNIIRFFYDEEQKPRIEGKFNSSSICVFVADGKNSKFSMLTPPKDKVMKEFWRRGFYKGHLSEGGFTAYGYYKFCKDIYDCRPEDVLLPNKWDEYKDGRGEYVLKDMIKNGKRIASLYIAYENHRINKWFFYDKKEFNEELCKEFFKDCPLDIIWNI